MKIKKFESLTMPVGHDRRNFLFTPYAFWAALSFSKTEKW